MRQFQMKTRWGTEHVVLMEASEIPAISRTLDRRTNDHWHGGSHDELIQKSEIGDNDLVASSDRFLSEIEDQVPVTRGWRNVEDVVGAVPNIPAFLAGHPQHMRRRERVSRDNAPLALYVDLTSQATINAVTVQRRGVVLLALARMLVEHRPVTLWAGITQDVGHNAGTVAWRIDTTPMDLARSAYHIGSTNISRRFGYGVNKKLNGSGGGWAFANHNLQLTTGRERAQQMLEVGEVIHVPMIYGDDPMLNDPVNWIKRTMAQYVNTDGEAS